MQTLKSSLLLPSSGPSLGTVTNWLNIIVLLYLATSLTAERSSSTAIADHLQDGRKRNIDQISQKDHDIRVKDWGFEQSCPNAEDISPCICIYDESNYAMDMDCSGIESEKQLKQVFEANFPLEKFRVFEIGGNTNLKVLESSVFGNISFEEINIYNSDIEIVEADAFNSCYETATRLYFNYNKITSFPFIDIKKLSKLSYFGIDRNYLDSVPLDSFEGLTSLETISVGYNNSTFIGTFQDIPNLKYLYSSYHNLSTIQPNFFKTGSNDLREINIHHCQIVSVEPDAFDILKGLSVYLASNLLTTLAEATWRPLLEAGVYLYAEDNPLNCFSCDLAWLFVGEDHLLDYVSKPTTCDDGQYLHDLDPKMFDLC